MPYYCECSVALRFPEESVGKRVTCPRCKAIHDVTLAIYRQSNPVSGGRWYDPATGRWNSSDPLGFAAGDHLLEAFVRGADGCQKDG